MLIKWRIHGKDISSYDLYKVIVRGESLNQTLCRLLCNFLIQPHFNYACIPENRLVSLGKICPLLFKT